MYNKYCVYAKSASPHTFKYEHLWRLIFRRRSLGGVVLVGEASRKVATLSACSPTVASSRKATHMPPTHGRQDISKAARHVEWEYNKSTCTKKNTNYDFDQISQPYANMHHSVLDHIRYTNNKTNTLCAFPDTFPHTCPPPPLYLGDKGIHAGIQARFLGSFRCVCRQPCEPSGAKKYTPHALSDEKQCWFRYGMWFCRPATKTNRRRVGTEKEGTEIRVLQCFILESLGP